MKNYKKC